DFRTRRRLAVGQGFINATVEIVGLANMAGEKAQLAGGASTLAFKATRRQAGFLRADFGDGGSARFDFVGNGFEEQSAFFATCISISPESIFCRFAGARHQSSRANREFMRWTRRRCRGKSRLPRNPLASYQVLSMGCPAHLNSFP